MESPRQRIVQQWQAQANPFFVKHAYPEGLIALVEQAESKAAHPHHLLTLARIALHLGRGQTARSLGQLALGNVQPAATGLRYEITQFLAQASAA
jgi:hypothetical protein